MVDDYEAMVTSVLILVSPVKVFAPANKNVPVPDFVKLEDPVIIPP